MERRFAIIAGVFFWGLSASYGFGQSTTSEEEEETGVKTVLDNSPIHSSRAAGMSRAITPIADDIDAVYFNPAGIGGLEWEKDGKSKKPFVRKGYFPYLAGEANENAQDLQGKLAAGGADSDKAAGSAIFKSTQGERQYARGSVAFGAVVSRLAIVPFTDQQVAAVSQGDDAATTDFRYRATTGALVGLSLSDPSGNICIGASREQGTLEEVSGEYPFAKLSQIEDRQAILDERKKYSLGSNHVGLIWRISSVANPRLGVAMRHMGDTTLSEDVVLQEDMSVGFSLSPKVGKYGHLNIVLQGDELSQDNTTLSKKLRSGMEFLLGEQGSYAVVGLRAGATTAGPSFGMSLNLGLLMFEASYQSVDVGRGNTRLIESRMGATATVNVASM